MREGFKSWHMDDRLVTPVEWWFISTGLVMAGMYGAVLMDYLAFERALAVVVGAGVLIALVVIVVFNAGSELVESSRLQARK